MGNISNEETTIRGRYKGYKNNVLAEQAAPTATAERQRINQLWMHQQERQAEVRIQPQVHISTS
jgi:hypothetical protein